MLVYPTQLQGETMDYDYDMTIPSDISYLRHVIL